MASDDKSRSSSAITVVEYLEFLALRKYFIRIQSVSGRLFIFASHPGRGDRSGNGKSLEKCIAMMKENGEEEDDAGHGRK